MNLRKLQWPIGVSRRPPARRSCVAGWSLAEMLIVVLIIGLIGTMAIPAARPNSEERVELASVALASAVEFARDQSRLTGDVHGVAVETADNRVRVFRLDQSVDPNLQVFDPRHPVTKQLYALQLGASPYAEVTLGSLAGTWTGSCSQASAVAFTAEGVTICPEPVSVRLEGASISISGSNTTASVSIDALTGRVVAQ